MVQRMSADERSSESRDLAHRTAILVTGMHRSGTSALARTMALLGAELPKDLVPPDEGNPLGHWEPQRLLDLNDRMLRAAGSELYGALDIDPSWFASDDARAFTDEAADLIVEAFGDHRLVVFKDPRTALMLPIWKPALARCGYRTVHVLPLRSPGAVAESLRHRHMKSIPYDGWPRPRGETVWLRYTLAAVCGTRGDARLIVPYQALLRDWRATMARVGDELGFAWPRWNTESEGEIDAFLHEGRHSGEAAAEAAELRADDDLAALELSELASALHAVLARTGDDRAVIDAIRTEYRRRMSGTGELIRSFEDLYPLVWHYYQATRPKAPAEPGEEHLRETVQRLWASLNNSNDDRAALRSELATAQHRLHESERMVRELEAARQPAAIQPVAPEPNRRVPRLPWITQPWIRRPLRAVYHSLRR